MIRPSTFIRVAVVVLVIGVLAQLSAGSTLWASTSEDVERQTLPTFTFTPGPTTPTNTPEATPTTPPTRTPPGATNTPASSPSDTPTPTPAQAVQVTVSANTDVYDGPGFDYAIIGSLEEGDAVVIIGRNADSTWWQIFFQQDTGWIFGEALDLIPAAYEVPVVSVSPPGAAVQAPSTLPEAGSGLLLLGGAALLLVSGALSLLVGSRARRRED